ncbi:hypothetical protein [Phyllobacterium bourgognense]|uniref:HD domain-containing protein n=1 Tax=Phyllobacterium bourgognense TaxID=314236 RepID=A0A368YPS7_9HYPH|nr:hypothetical protein [Phyllobacterium bourgognense]RCW81589.1 hypothetical protein C7476_110143 [Phyllobacterium bourgognense]
MTSLEHAISIAASAHAAYLADDEEPYIFHPLRVMLALDGEDERMVGVLHDVVDWRDFGESIDSTTGEPICVHCATTA